MYEPHLKGGVIKQLKTKLVLKFSSYEEAVLNSTSDSLPLDGNMAVADFEKMENSQASHVAFLALELFREKHQRLPKPWNFEDAEAFVAVARSLSEKFKLGELKKDSLQLRLMYLFAFQAVGVFNPLCAFIGGFVAQESIKAIT